MQTILLSREEVARRARELYEASIRQHVEQEENIGQMVVIDVETGEYRIDKTGLASARYLRGKRPHARLFGIRIGYNAAASLGGIMAKLPKQILITIFTLQQQIAAGIEEAATAEWVLLEQYGETEATIPELEELQNARERLTAPYSRLHTLLLRILES